jgi:hypothetical protein
MLELRRQLRIIPRMVFGPPVAPGLFPKVRKRSPDWLPILPLIAALRALNARQMTRFACGSPTRSLMVSQGRPTSCTLLYKLMDHET